ncbi:MAG: UDP-N-acetylglucosamine 2-epimerase [Omnitrophica WOR_2 bacterium RBG_13_41_10]|nr:MAG: UDP-N-acetylglucosamine 2-epimerase [Omnitrophica WOR_2 bacterium RBG_13_41_10]
MKAIKMKYKICTLIGTRPEAIKLAPVIKEIERRSDKIDSLVVVTAQHRQMLDQVLNLFSIRPKYDIDIMRPGQDLFDVTNRALLGLRPILEKEKPDLVIIQGDTTTVLVGALAAFYLNIPIAHVEAGLRTQNKHQPFPEEVNRRIATILADLHFAPTEIARNNLLREGIPKERIYVTGNTVVDAMLSALDKDFIFGNARLQQINFKEKRVILVTAHRRENWGKPLVNICYAIRDIIFKFPEVIVIFSVHPNPQVQRIINKNLSDIERIYLLKPLGYKDFVNLMDRSYIILTDSGGIQEEASSLKKPVLVLRNVTERQEAMISGTAKLVGTDSKKIFKEVSKLLKNFSAYRTMTYYFNPYGKGKASEKIVQVILEYIKTSPQTLHKPIKSIEPPLT